MREIKFRTYVRFLREMHEVREMIFDKGAVMIDAYQYGLDRDDAPVMQFTGLKDKNSNEIYEHDIAKISVDGHTSISTKVIFECGSFWLYSLDLPSVFDSDIDGMVRLSTLCLELEGFELNQLHQLEVIGNIHQHPELLDGDK